MSELHLNDLSKIYLDQIAEKKKDDSYLETDMKKRQANNEKARKELAKGPQMKNPHFEEFELDESDSLAAMQARREKRLAAQRKKMGTSSTGQDFGHDYGISSAERKKRQKAEFDKFVSRGKKTQKEALDPVGKEDGDVNNDGKKDSSDKYLMKRRKAIAKALGKKDINEQDAADEKRMSTFQKLQKNVDQKKKLNIRGNDSAEQKARLEKKRGMKLDDHPQFKKEEVENPSKDLKSAVKKAVKRIDHNVSGDVDKNDKSMGNYGEFVPSVDGKKKLTTKIGESYSSWRTDLAEVMDDIESKPIKEKAVKNKVTINPKLSEAVEEIGGQVLEVTEVQEEASMSPQEVQLQKKKAMIDKMIATKRQQGLSKAKKSEEPAKAMGEEMSIKDQMRISKEYNRKSPEEKKAIHKKAVAGIPKGKPKKDTRTDAQKMTDATGPRPGSRYRGD